MHRKVLFFLILSTIFAIFTCSKKINQSSLKPPKVTMIPTAADTSRIEKGIDAIPNGDGIRIEWSLSSDERVTGYEIYRKETLSAKFTKIWTAAEKDTFYEDFTTKTGIRYYYTILAVNDEDLRSETSDTLNFMLLKKATNLNTTIGSSKTKPVFNWLDSNQAGEFIVRIEEKIGNRPIWIALVQADYGSSQQSVNFNFDQKALMNELVLGKEYRWRVDVVGHEVNSGSESEWIPLTIQ
jgi:fibronectin type 3 domain-containing protein